MFHGISEQKATALSVGFMESAFSPWFWALTLVFLAMFVAASRLRNKTVRILLFWIPTVAVSILGLAITGLLTYLFFHFRHS
jgi:hypothetical protein